MASRDVDDICFRCGNHLEDPYALGEPCDTEWKILFDCPNQQYHCLGHKRCQTLQRFGNRNAKCLACKAPKLEQPITLRSLQEISCMGTMMCRNNKSFPVFQFITQARITAPRAITTRQEDNSRVGSTDSLLDGEGRGRARSRGRGRGRGRGRSSFLSTDEQRGTRRSGPRLAGESDDYSSYRDDSILNDDVAAAPAAGAEARSTDSDSDSSSPGFSRSTSPTPSSRGGRSRTSRSYSPSPSSRGGRRRVSRLYSPSPSSPGEVSHRARSASPSPSSPGGSLRGSAAVAALPVVAGGGGAFYALPHLAGPSASPLMELAAVARAMIAAGPEFPAMAGPAAAAGLPGPAVEPRAVPVVHWPEVGEEDRGPAAAEAPAPAPVALGAAANPEGGSDVVDLTDSPVRIPTILISLDNYAENLEPYIDQLVLQARNDPNLLCELISKLINTPPPPSELYCNSLVQFFRNIIMKIHLGRVDRWKFSCRNQVELDLQLAPMDDAKYIELMVDRVNRSFDRMIQGVTMHMVGTQFRVSLTKTIYNMARAHSFLVAVRFIQEGQYKTSVVLISKMINKVYDEVMRMLRDDMPNKLRTVQSYDSYYMNDDQMNVISFNGMEFCRYFTRFSSICAFRMLVKFLKLTEVNSDTKIGKLTEDVSEKNYEAYLILCDLVVQRAYDDCVQIDSINNQMGRTNTEIGDSDRLNMFAYLATMRHYLRAYETSGEKHDWPIWKHIVPVLTDPRDENTLNQILGMNCALCMNAFVNGPESTEENNFSKLELRFSCMHIFHTDCMDRAMSLTCPLCRNPYPRKDAAGSSMSIHFTTSDFINNKQINDQGRNALVRVSRLARFQTIPQRVITEEEKQKLERERRATEALQQAREQAARGPNHNEARRRLAERILVDSEKNQNQKRRRLVSSEGPVDGAVTVESTPSAAVELIVVATDSAAATVSTELQANDAAVETASVDAVGSAPSAAATVSTELQANDAAVESVSAVSTQPTAVLPGRPETGRLTALLAAASDVGTLAPGPPLPRLEKARQKLTIDAVSHYKQLRKFLRILIKCRRGEPTMVRPGESNITWDENSILQSIEAFKKLITNVDSILYDVSEVTAFVERVLAKDEAACAELLAIYDRLDAEGAGGGGGA